jgi:antitoxin HigA-1
MRRPPTHPGEIFLKQFLEGSAAHDNQTTAARVLGWSVDRKNEFVLEKRPLTYEDAIDLAEATNTNPEFWATLQLRHDLGMRCKLARTRRDEAQYGFHPTEISGQDPT